MAEKQHRCSKCKKLKPLSQFYKNSLTKAGVCQCKNCSAAAARKSLEKIKAEVFKAYGGKCKRCKIADIEVLTIDHQNQQGSKHRRETGLSNGGPMYRWLKANNYPKGFRVLCFNCNIKVYRKYLRSISL